MTSIAKRQPKLSCSQFADAAQSLSKSAKRLALFLLLGLLWLAAASRVWAQAPVSPPEAMLAGNQNYESGDYRAASEIYETIIAAGVYDSAVFYNLGNAYYKQGDLGRAILNYRRAQRLDPRDSDISANLDVARSQSLDRFEANQGTLTNVVQVAEEWLTLNEAALLALILWVLLAVCLIMAIIWRRLRPVLVWLIVVLSLFFIIGLVSMASRMVRSYNYRPAVIVAQKTDVTSGPGTSEQYLVEFELHSGAEVVLLESRPNWRRIALPGNDFQGWVPVEAVEAVAED